MLAVTGSKHGNSRFLYLALVFPFLSSFFFWSQFWLGLGLGLGPGIVLVLFLRSKLCLLHEDDNRRLFEMSSTVTMATSVYESHKVEWTVL